MDSGLSRRKGNQLDQCGTSCVLIETCVGGGIESEQEQNEKRKRKTPVKIDVALGDLAKTKVSGRGFGELR